MSHDTLAIIWFVLWGILWTTYFVLDAYSLGTGILFAFIAKDRQERNQLQETIGPFWSGNEVWLITAGGATFAAFPETYANMFSFLYTPLMLILFALFFRGAGLEFMHKDEAPWWQSSWKWAFTIGSFMITILFGVTFANLYYGLLIGQHGYEGNLLSLLHPYGLLGGVLFVSLFLLSGSLWIQLKTSGIIAERTRKLSKPLSYVTALIVAIFFVATNNKTTLFVSYAHTPILWVIPSLSIVAILSVVMFTFRGKIGLAFTSICLTIFTLMASGFAGMFPNMLPSRINQNYSTTLYDAAGSTLTLKIMFFVALFLVPVVISYQLWSYNLFKNKISKDSAKGYQ